jgi:hypothetical protein
MALNQPGLAEKYHQRMFEPAKAVPLAIGLVPYYSNGRFYFRINQYQRAKRYLDSTTKYPTLVPATVQADVHFMLYKIDSAQNDFLAAIKHFNSYKEINDTIYNAKKSRQVAELNIRYEVEKNNSELLLKDQALQLNQKDIEILTNKGLLQSVENEKRQKDLVLKEQDIVLLKKETDL